MSGGKSGKAAKTPKFRLTRTRSAARELKDVPALLHRRIQERLQRLAREGCRAADYALSGPEPWPRFCSIHIDGWRIVVTFPAEDEVAVVKVSPHDDRHDPYATIAAELGIDISTEERTKPPCCKGGVPPVAEDLLDHLEEAFDRLTAAERRSRR